MTMSHACQALVAIAAGYLCLPATALSTQVGALIEMTPVAATTTTSAAPPSDPITAAVSGSNGGVTSVMDQATTQEKASLDDQVAELEQRAAAAEAEAQKARDKEKEAFERLQIARSESRKEDARIAVDNAGSASAYAQRKAYDEGREEMNAEHIEAERIKNTERIEAMNADLQHALSNAQVASVAHRDAEKLANDQFQKRFAQARASADAISNDARSASFVAGAYAQREEDQKKIKELSKALEDNAEAAKEGYAIHSKVNALASNAGKEIGEAASKYRSNSPAGLRVAEVLSEASYSTDTLNKLQHEVNSTRKA